MAWRRALGVRTKLFTDRLGHVVNRSGGWLTDALEGCSEDLGNAFVLALR
jgi:hypothetical protein